MFGSKLYSRLYLMVMLLLRILRNQITLGGEVQMNDIFLLSLAQGSSFVCDIMLVLSLPDKHFVVEIALLERKYCGLILVSNIIFGQEMCSRHYQLYLHCREIGWLTSDVGTFMYVLVTASQGLSYS